MAKTLLLADDSVTIQKVVGISFAGEDVDLITVDNGDDAIAKAREVRPDVILSDVVMPGKNGYEVCEAIKSDPSLAHIPVLLLTGTFESFDEERAQRCGAAGHVAKPFEAQTLVSRVAELLANPAPPAAQPEPPSAPSPQPPPVASTPIGTMSGPSAPESVNDQSFDFFDDELAAPPPAAAPDRVAPVDLDPTDSAFAFGDEDLGASASGSDRTVAMLADEPDSPLPPPPAPPLEQPLAAPIAGPEDTLSAAPQTPASSDLLPPLETAGASDEGFDFESGGSFGESDLLAPLSDDELAQETILDPKGASGYDVSSSDLRESSAGAAAASLPPAADPAPPPPPASGDATVMVSPDMPGAAGPDPAAVGADLFSDDVPVDIAPPIDPGRETVLASPEPELDDSSLDAMVPAAPVAPPAPEPTPEPVAAAQPMAPPPAPPEPPPIPAPEPFAAPEPEPIAAAEPTPEPEPIALAEPASEPEPFAAPEPMPEPMPFTAPEPIAAAEPTPAAMPEPLAAPEPMPAAEPFAPEASSLDTEAIAGDLVAELEPRLREELHDTLEKIAWESMGDVAEQIIRQAVERVERVAWEVIPQMAETMIREEIRKLKGEGQG